MCVRLTALCVCVCVCAPPIHPPCTPSYVHTKPILRSTPHLHPALHPLPTLHPFPTSVYRPGVYHVGVYHVCVCVQWTTEMTTKMDTRLQHWTFLIKGHTGIYILRPRDIPPAEQPVALRRILRHQGSFRWRAEQGWGKPILHVSMSKHKRTSDPCSLRAGMYETRLHGQGQEER